MNKGLELIEAVWLFGLPPDEDPDRGAAPERCPLCRAVQR
mgnify:CR=1 FL=1